MTSPFLLLFLPFASSCLPPNATSGLFVQADADSLSADGSDCHPYTSVLSAHWALPAEGGRIIIQPSSTQLSVGGLGVTKNVWIDGCGGNFIMDRGGYVTGTLVLYNMTVTASEYVGIWVIGLMSMQECAIYELKSEFIMLMGVFEIANSRLNISLGTIATVVAYSAVIIFRDSVFTDFNYAAGLEFWMFRAPTGSHAAVLFQNCTLSHFRIAVRLTVTMGITAQTTNTVSSVILINSHFDDFIEYVFRVNAMYYSLQISGCSFSRGPVAFLLALNDNQTHTFHASQFSDVSQAVSITYLTGSITFSQCQFARMNQSLSLIQGTRTSDLSVLDSNFTDIGNATTVGSALFAQNAGKISLTRCRVQNSIAKSGGVMYSYYQVSAKILGGYFANLVADNAPVFDLQYTEASIQGIVVDTAQTKGHVFSFIGQAATLTSVTLRNLSGDGSVLYGFEAATRIHDSLIENCSSGDQFMTLSTSATPCYTSNTNFRNISFGTVFVQPYIEQIYQFDNVTFHVLQPASTGILFSNFGTLITAQKCRFSGALAVLVGGVGPVGSTFLNECVFADLTVKSLFAPSSATLQVVNSTFTNVKVSHANNYPVSTTAVTFLNVSFTEVAGQVLSSKQSTFTLAELQIQNCTVPEDSSWMDMLLSAVTISNSEVGSVQLGPRSSLFKLDFQSSLTVSGIRFRGIQGKLIAGVIVAKQSSLQISRVTASLLASSFITASECSLSLNNSEFWDIGQDSSPMYDGGVVQAVQMLGVSIVHCNFTRVRARSGGAVYVSYSNPNKASLLRQMNTTGYVLVSQCLFESCVSTQDGAAVYFEAATVTISASVFHMCSAAGNGGAIALYCDPAEVQFTCFYHVNETSFTNNTADLGGGAIKYDKVKPLLSNVTDSHNSASYGSFLAAFPVELRYLKASPSITGESGSRMSESLDLGLYDEWGQLVTTDNQSKGSLRAQKSALVSGLQVVRARQGIFTFAGLSVADTPGSEVGLQLSSDAIDYQHPNPNTGSKSQSLTIRLFLRSCVLGEIIANQACDKCVSGTYSFNTSDTVCKSCPAGLTCHAGANTTVAQDYWRPANTSELLLECYAKDICLGGNLAQCETGYTGRLCTFCEQGYFRYGNFFCLPCGSTVWGVIRGILVVLGTAVFLIIMIAGNLRNRLEKKSTMSVHFRIFLNYNQVSMLMSNLQVKWPVDLLSFFEGLKFTGSAGQFAFSNECISGESTINYLYQKVIVMAVTPAILIVLALLLWGFVALVRRKLEYLRVHAMCSVIVLLLSMQPIVLQAALQLYPCVEVEPGSLWLLHDMRIACWQGDHLTYAFALALPAILVWCVATPLLFWALLFRQRFVLYHPSNIRRIGFLYSGYHRRYYFWEFVVVLRKSLMVITANLLMTVQSKIQAEIAICILWVFVVLQHKQRPFETNSFNRLELLSLLASLVTVVTGSLYLSDLRTQPGAYYGLLTTAFAFNVLFMLVWLVLLIVYLTRSSSKKVTAIWHWLDKTHTRN